MISKFKVYSLINKAKAMAGYKITDDFDWSIYNIHYRGELENISKLNTLVLKEGDYSFQNGNLKRINHTILPLHPNHRLLYETILQLNPNSVIEFGCGGGDHLKNISILLPSVHLSGLELLSSQIRLCGKRHPKLKADIKKNDCTLPLPDNFARFDIAYTQAVIMHLKTSNNHLTALANLFRSASKQVILMENWKAHNFFEDIKRLFSLKMIPWENIFFYLRDSEELKKPHIMVVSANPLPQYTKLEDYSILSSNV